MNSRLFTALFGTTVFASAFLLFQVQPLISKFILPWFGGSPTVWSICMLFFQIVLFGGYVYAHATSQWLRPRTQAITHIALLALAAAVLPIAPDDTWKPTNQEAPTQQIVLLLACCVGLPYFVLSSTGPLLQRWFSIQNSGKSPYRLYALSNVGSLLALLSYPFLVEPTISSPLQAQYWSWAFVVFATICAGCAWGQFRVKPLDTTSSNESQIASDGPPSWGDRAMWVGLAATASVMLLATTNQICLDISPVPFLWIVPLAIYLMSFILCFDTDRWYSRNWYMGLLFISLLFSVKTLLVGSTASILLQVVTYLAALFFGCMVCHGELAKQKPHPQYLTQFFLLLSAGGASGGLFVGLLAPAIFPAYWEFHLAIFACLLVALVVWYREGKQAPPPSADAAVAQFRPTMLVWPLAGLWMVSSLQAHAMHNVNNAIEVSRNFYGVLRIEEPTPTLGRPTLRRMVHGNIVHGTQFADEERQDWPTTYYGRQSGAGIVLQHHLSHAPRKIGVVGLGAGTLATYGQAEDHIRFYEINPDVIRLAKTHFSFLRQTSAKVDIVAGDARLSMEQESQQHYDVLILDAFSGDAIPTHLLTREAALEYDRHLNENGILCIHISNLHFDLRPIAAALAKEFSWHVLGVRDSANQQAGTKASRWILLSKQPLSTPIIKAARTFDLDAAPVLWTDEWTNLLAVLRRK